MDIAIIGGGISGLATAFYINFFGEGKHNVTVLEKDNVIGGKMQTHDIGGYLVEEGSNGFLSNRPDTIELIRLAGLENILLKSNDNARVRFIYKDKLYKMPETPKDFLLSGIMSPLGKLRVACEYLIPQKKDDKEETLKEFGYRRVGKELTETFLDPMVAGVFASTPDDISVKASFEKIVAMEDKYGGLIKAMLAMKSKSAAPAGVLMSFKGGCQELIKGIASKAEADIKCGYEVKTLSKKDDKFIINDELKFDKVIVSLPAYVTADLVKELAPDTFRRLNAIEYTPISVVGLGYEKIDHDLRGFGLLTTSSSKQPALGVVWDSSMFYDRAPEGGALLRVMIGGQRDKDLGLKDDKTLVELAKLSVRNTMGVNDKVSKTYVKRHEKGIPNYGLGHMANVNEIFKEIRRVDGLYLNSNAYKGVAMNECIKNSRLTARDVLGLGAE
ncbi:MAG: protoporphyrinogen oxidase [Campylobacter sp.]|nr:protoporphyrinogen oxidase [Campylobacter sp.]